MTKKEKRKVVLDFIKKNYGQIIQYIAKKYLDKDTLLSEKCKAITVMTTPQLQSEIWMAMMRNGMITSLEESYPNILEYEIEDVVLHLWDDDIGNSDWLHSFDVKPVINSMIINLYYLSKIS